MPSFAFWNINRKDLNAATRSLVEAKNLDVLLLCEPDGDPDELIVGLNELDQGLYYRVPVLAPRFQVYTRLMNEFIRPRFDGPRCSVLTISIPGIPPFNLMLIHANCANYHSDQNIALELIEIAKQLRLIESEDGHTRSIVVGDFNQNPYSTGLLAANGFHAIMDAAEARKGSRIVQQKPWDYFYNPMWSLMGDRSKGPPGTHFYRGNGLVEQQWHMLDQVIVRPSLLEFFDLEKLEILTALGKLPLLTASNRPRRSDLSDHLPIYFELNT
ncbi:hypothetical protein [Luteolibacter soli]|uniref:Endonuclease/exonuclease/phosphatase domain-containing protein n=1 Tax=Luteolibacter soli TaxID=3135280 RepID=A0ABU9ARR2_9BACT